MTTANGGVPLDLDELLALLASYSLITLTAETISIHRLLQATVRAQQTPAADGYTTPAAGQSVALAWMTAAVPRTNPSRDVAGWVRWRDLLPHLVALFSYLPANLHDLHLAALLGESGIYAPNAHGRLSATSYSEALS